MTYDPKHCRMLCQKARQYLADTGCWSPLPEAAIRWLREGALVELVYQLESAVSETERLTGELNVARSVIEHLTEAGDAIHQDQVVMRHDGDVAPIVGEL